MNIMIKQKFYLVFLFIGLTAGVFTGCEYAIGIEGDGNVVAKERKVTPFDQIDVSGAFTVVLKQGEREAVTVEADENLHEIIIVKVVGGTLLIDSEQNIRQAKKREVQVTFTELDRVEISGAVTLKNESMLELKNLMIEGRGASTIDMQVAAGRLDCKFSGASTVNLTGHAEHFSVELSGASDLNTFDLDAANVHLVVRGAGDARIAASEYLNVSISGAGSVIYQGDPQIEKHISGAGSVKKR
jgi:hypothetical protein